MKRGTTNSIGHSNRILSIKFTKDPNIMISGGWDNTLLIWDIRDYIPLACIYGPHIWGDSIDINGDLILTGSHR